MLPQIYLYQSNFFLNFAHACPSKLGYINSLEITDARPAPLPGVRLSAPGSQEPQGNILALFTAIFPAWVGNKVGNEFRGEKEGVSFFS
jgi:hypothetical protein